MATQLKKNLQEDAEVMGMKFIHRNFEKERFMDDSFNAWEGRKEHSPYKLRVTNYLFNSIQVFENRPNRLVFGSGDPKAEIHNNGRIVRIRITEKSCNFFWYRYKSTGKEKWKFMVLTKKTQILFRMPKRQFKGESKTFRQHQKKNFNTI